jgi:hypothetical protein
MKHTLVCSLCVLTASVLPAQNWFKAQRLLERPGDEIRLVGDLDLDGDLDCVLFTGANLQSFTVLTNNSHGVFTAGNPVALPAGGAQYVALADVDGDGFPDIITTTLNNYAQGNGLLVFFGLGNCAFGAPMFIPLPGVVAQLRVGNADGDGIADLAIVQYDPAPNAWVARWIRGSPTRSFVPGTSRQLPLTYYSDLAVFDANGDGLDDFALLDNTGVQFLFTAASSPSVTGPFLPLSLPFFLSLAAIDLDHDGRRDLIVCSIGSSYVLQIDKFRNAGGGTWTPFGSQTFANTTSAQPFVGDWDGDGIDDLVLRGRPFSLLRGDGAGSLVPGCTLMLPAGSTGVGLFDLDGDGHLDFVDAQALYFGDGTFDPPFGTVDPVQTNVPMDLDGDGDPDLAGASVQQWNDGRGVFTERSLTLPPPPGPGFSWGEAALVGDLDGNGQRDYLAPLVQILPTFPYPTVVFVAMHRLEETGTGALADRGVAVPAGVEILGQGPIFADDVDGDGDLDLVNEQGVWLNNGAQSFTPPTADFGGYRPICRGDVDGDGHQDYLAVALNSPLSGRGLALLRHTGPATFTVQPLAGPPGTDLTWISNLADLDGDGDLDIVAGSITGSLPTITILANQGGVFAPAVTMPFNASQLPDNILCGDIDGDGRVDLVMCAQQFFRIYVLRRNGPGFSYDPPVVFMAPAMHALVDIDQDGDLDAVGGGVLFNRRFDGPGAGMRRQYGNPSAGAGGLQPVLGAAGPIRTGFTPVLRLRQAVGGSFALLVVGGGEANLPSPVLPGLVVYESPIILTLGFVTSGAFGQPGAGAVDLPLTIPPGYFGTRLFFQYVVFDAAGQSGVAHSNGLEFAIGF